MKIAKEFRWEMGHRLPEHTGLCKNIHGHSYRMLVEITGDVLDNGMIIDFYDLGRVVKPILETLDHCFLVYSKDKIVLDFLKKNKMKMVIVDYLGTVENICKDVSEKIVTAFKKKEDKEHKRNIGEDIRDSELLCTDEYEDVILITNHAFPRWRGCAKTDNNYKLEFYKLQNNL